MKKPLAALLLAPGLALGQGYPAKPARIIVLGKLIHDNGIKVA
jgi:hypothetical protein